MRPRAFVLALAVVTALAGVAWQRNTLAHLRAENRKLHSESELMARLKRENSIVEQLRLENRELAKLREETHDLHKLRNEVRQLRDQVQGLAGVRAENTRLRSSGSPSATKNTPTADPRPSFTLDALSFAGYATPEATLQTMFWAARQGDFDGAMKCFSEEARKEMVEDSPEDVRRGMEEMLKRFKGLRIAARRVISADEIQLGIQLSIEGNDTPDEQAVRFKLVGGEWRLGSMK